MKYKFKSKVEELSFDIHTPVGIYLKVRDIFPQCLLFESAAYADKSSGFSYICCHPLAGIEVTGNGIFEYFKHEESNNANILNTIDYLNFYIRQFEFEKASPTCCNAKFFGHFNYDAVRYFSDIDIPFPNHTEIPDIRLHLYQFVFVFDHALQKLYITEFFTDYTDEVSKDKLLSVLEGPVGVPYKFYTVGNEESLTSDEEFLNFVNTGKMHCKKGDVFQIVLSRRYSIDFIGDDFNVYRSLKTINPSPYLFYLDYGNYRIFGSSPEAQLVVKNGKSVIHPIAGTYHRTGDRVRDEQLSLQLKNDPKENAEHVMLVDLARNDLSKSHNSVSVTQYKELQNYAYVIHIVSEVTGEQPTHDNKIQILADSFPAGTLSGAPKHKAMQLISKYEKAARGYYGGCAGYVSADGEVNMAIMIRSFLSKGGKLYYQAGAGITNNSIDKNELEEINNKLKALRTALKVSNALKEMNHENTIN